MSLSVLLMRLRWISGILKPPGGDAVHQALLESMITPFTSCFLSLDEGVDKWQINLQTYLLLQVFSLPSF